ncbi:RipA family octameric membrane protein [Cedecea neteri]|uniref:RipA family octameric membrane protein n=1 Tax=Cedecea neteri TaxID=158822 RepID=UPI003F706646
MTAVLFTGWGVMLNSMINPEEGHLINGLQYFTLFFISIFGVALTTVSRLITKAGKHWQQVWEYHLMALEPFQSGSLYRLKFKSYRIDLPSISQSVSLFHVFLLLMWCGSALLSAIIPFFKDDHAFLIVEVVVLILIYQIYKRINKYVLKSSNIDLTLM